MTWDSFDEVVRWTWGTQPDDLAGLSQVAATLGAEPVDPFPVQVTAPGLEDGSTGKTIRGILPEGRGVYAIGVWGDRHRVLYVGRSGKDDGTTRKTGGVGGRLWGGYHPKVPDWSTAHLLTSAGAGLPAELRSKLEATPPKRVSRHQFYRCLLTAFDVDVVTLHVWATDRPEKVERRMLDYCEKVHDRPLPLHGT